jgi:hypothetical protein
MEFDKENNELLIKFKKHETFMTNKFDTQGE